MGARENHPTREKRDAAVREKNFPSHRRAAPHPVLGWGDFHRYSRFARSTFPEEKWGVLVV